MKLDHEKMVEALYKEAKDRGGSDSSQLTCTICDWDLFMDSYVELFGGITRKEHWHRKHLGGRNDRPEGILRLMNGTTGYKKLFNKWNKIKQKAGKQDVKDQTTLYS